MLLNLVSSLFVVGCLGFSSKNYDHKIETLDNKNKITQTNNIYDLNSVSISDTYEYASDLTIYKLPTGKDFENYLWHDYYDLYFNSESSYYHSLIFVSLLYDTNNITHARSLLEIQFNYSDNQPTLSVVSHAQILPNDNLYNTKYFSKGINRTLYSNFEEGRVKVSYEDDLISHQGDDDLCETLYKFVTLAFCKEFSNQGTTIEFLSDYNIGYLFSTSLQYGCFFYQVDSLSTLPLTYNIYLTFNCRGNTYYGIRFNLLTTANNNFKWSQSKNGTVHSGFGDPSNPYVYVMSVDYLSYTNNLNNVYTYDYGNNSSGTESYIVSESGHFIIDDYRKIEIIYMAPSVCYSNNPYLYRVDNYPRGNEMTAFDFLSKNADYINIISNDRPFGDVGDVIGFVNLGFTGLINLFTIQILPGLSLGLFIFLPLVFTILFAVVKLFKR